MMKIIKTTLIFLLYITAFICGTSNAAVSVSNIGKDVLDSFGDVTSGIAQKFPAALPTPTAFFSGSKNLLAGYPVEALFRAINTFCSAALSSQTIKPRVLPNLAPLSFILYTKDSRYTIPIKDASKLWEHRDFNRQLETVILVTGWTTSVNDTNSGLEQIRDAYICRGGKNFIAVDTAKFVDTLYTWSAFNTEEIGKLIAEGVNKLVQTYPVEKIHLIGHSLGAHIVGSIGRHFTVLSGKMIPRITGLDPANPCFNEGENLSQLARGDADFVDIIHSNNGVLGKRDPLGDADFYPNGLSPLPPGCLSINCAHSRAFEYYAETVYPGNENGFMGVKCRSATALNSGNCNGRKYPMGFAVPKNLKGNFFLNTKSRSPFGENSKPKKDIICKK